MEWAKKNKLHWPHQVIIRRFDIKPALWKCGSMKTTLDLPDELLRAVKVRAARSNRRFKDVVAELLAKGMSEPAQPPSRQNDVAPRQVEISDETGLPLIRSPGNAPISSMSTDEIYALIHRTQIEEDIENVGRGFPSR